MSFDLQITFGGMFLLVRDYEVGKSSVLLPKVENHRPAHTATMHFYRNGKIEQRDLPPHVDLTGLPTADGLSFELPQRLIDLDLITREPIARDILEPGHDLLSSLVDIDKGRYQASARGGRWQLGNRPPRFMATAIVWVVRNIELSGGRDYLRERLGTDLEPNPSHPNGVNGQTLQLGIFNTPDNDKPSDLPSTGNQGEIPQPGDEVHHFSAFYRLYKDPANRPNPRFKDLGGRAGRNIDVAANITDPESTTGIRYTCIGGVATAAEQP